MSHYVTVWQCVGCGRIEGPQPCIGICEDHKLLLVPARVHDDALAELEGARTQASAFGALLRRLSHTNPRDGEWERSYRALQGQARRLLAGRSDERRVPAPTPPAATTSA